MSRGSAIADSMIIRMERVTGSIFRVLHTSSPLMLFGSTTSSRTRSGRTSRASRIAWQAHSASDIRYGRHSNTILTSSRTHGSSSTTRMVYKVMSLTGEVRDANGCSQPTIRAKAVPRNPSFTLFPDYYTYIVAHRYYAKITLAAAPGKVAIMKTTAGQTWASRSRGQRDFVERW